MGENEPVNKINFKTTNEVWKCVQLYKIHALKDDVNQALEDLVVLGWEKYKEGAGNGSDKR